MDRFVRSVCALAAVLIIGAVAHVNVMAHGGYGSTFSVLALAIAGGVIAASLAIGQAAGERKWAWVALLVVFIALGEASAFLSTAERVVVSREEKQAPLRELQDAREKAAQRVTAAEAALAAIPSTTERIRKAEAAKAAADAAVIEKSAERGCATNCRRLLQAQVDAAQVELDAARADLRSRRQAAETELRDARAALGVMKASASASPLADRLGVEPWILDVLTAALMSTSANGFACVLLVFGTHGGRREIEVVTGHVEPLPASKARQAPAGRTPTPRSEASRFCVECLVPGGEIELSTLKRQYRIWSERRQATAYPQAVIAEALADLFADNGIEVVERDGKMVAVGLSLAEPQRKALGHMASIRR